MPCFYKILPVHCVKILLGKQLLTKKGLIFINTIYIDVLFVVNLAINYAILLCMKCLLKLCSKPARLLGGGALGALYACIVYTTDVPLLSSVAIRILFASAIVGASFGFVSTACIVKRTVIFIALTVAMGVAMLGILYFTKLGIKLGGVVKNGVFYFDIPLHYILLCTFGAYALILILEKVFKKATSRSFSKIIIYRFGKAVELTALVDTGNMLSDPLTGRKVIIAEAGILAPLFNFCIEDVLKENFEYGSLPDGFRLIPYCSIGKKNGLLAAFVPDMVEIDSIKSDNTITAVFNGVLSGSGDYNALIGPNI